MTNATATDTPGVRIGTVDIPARVERERYFRELSYLELSLVFPGPAKPSALARWAELAPAGAIGLVAPFSLSHRQPPAGPKLWPHDTSTGDFRDSATSRAALSAFGEAADAVHAGALVFRSPPSLSPSAANRDHLRKFFTEVAPPGERPRVWVPGGLWEVGAALKLAGELEIVCAFDPLVREPGQPFEVFFELEVSALYLRIEGGRSGPLRNEQLEDLAALIEHHENLPVTVAFASPERWADARNLKKLLSS